MPYKFLVCLLSFVYYQVTVHAQYENVWVFGQKGAGLSFNSGVPVPINTNIGVYPGTAYEAFGESSASVCDASGQLLFYTEGFYVWDRNGNVMPNGRELVPVFQPNLTYTPTSSTSQGAVIVPMPGDPDKYYIFSLTAKEQWQASAGRLYYSLIDMSLNGGLGDVVPNQKGLFVDSFLAEKMTTTLGNACNIWLLACGIDAAGASNFKAYEITAFGLNTTPVISNVGLGNVYTPIGSFFASPNGKKIIATQTGAWGGLRGAALYDFDPNTGLISNPLQLLPNVGGYGACFSPDNTKVYVSTDRSDIYQFDLSLTNPNAIIASQVQVGDLASWSANLKLGPDGKVYFPYGNQFLGRIDLPNNAGVSCSLIPEAVEMLPGQETYVGLPNVVTVIPRDTFLSSQAVSAPCWANVSPAVLSPVQESGWDFVWQDGVTGSRRSIDTPGTYWVSYHTPPCNFHTDTFHVTFPNGVLPDITVNAACKGTSTGKAWATTYPGDPVTYFYAWFTAAGQDTLSRADSLPDALAGAYRVHIATNTGCDTVLYLDIPDIAPEVSFVVSDTLICLGDTIAASSTSDAYFSEFLWDFGDDTTASDAATTHTYTQPGAYLLTLTGTGELCMDSSSMTIIVDPPADDFEFSVDKEAICVGDKIQFQPGIDSTLTQLSWDFGEGNYLMTLSPGIVQHAYDAAGTLHVQLDAMPRACPPVSYSQSITVYPIPEVNLGKDSMLCLGGAPMVLVNRAEPSAGTYNYLWSTGDTTASLKVVHPGIYRLEVSAAPLGCTGTEQVVVHKDCYTDIPNAFTPNGDGANDYFFPRQYLSEGVTTFSFLVRNRWGQLVFETSAVDGRGWDGRLNGADQPSGVYVYEMNVRFQNGRIEKYLGNVTLLR